MPTIKLQKQHNQGKAKAHKLVDGIAKSMGAQYGIVPKWEGDNLKFNGMGVDGRIHVTDSAVTVDMDLGLLAAAFRNQIEQGFRTQLQAAFP